MISAHYSLCGVDLEVTAEERVPAERVGDLWPRLFAVEPRERRPGADAVRFRFRESGPATEPIAAPTYDDARLVRLPSSDGLDVWRCPSGFRLRSGTSDLRLDVGNGVAEGHLDPAFWELGAGEQREFFLLSFLMLLRPRGLYGLHANGLERDGVGVLLVGDSGSGKTTLTVALLRQGWRLVADDAVMLRSTASGIEAEALRRGLSLTAETAGRFPGLRAVHEHATDLADGKRLAAADDVAPGSEAHRCTPRLLLLPRVTRSEATEAVPVDDRDALSALIAQSPGILADGSDSAPQMAVLGALAAQCGTHALRLGRDVYDRPDRVSERIANLGGA